MDILIAPGSCDQHDIIVIPSARNPTMPSMNLDKDGACHFAGAARAKLPHLHAVAGSVTAVRGGTRLHGLPALSALLAPQSDLFALASARLGPRCRPVRAILFDKTRATNWTLGWHQDRVIAVRERIEVAGFRNWSIKQGLLHVEPPASLQTDMLTMRVHLDPVPTANAPLLIAPGSHRLGRIAEDRIAEVVAAHGCYACLAEAGDVWLYRTPIVHASAAATDGVRRRVLQIDFAACDLPSGLRWSGI